MLGKATHSADAQCPTYLDASMGLTPTPSVGARPLGALPALGPGVEFGLSSQLLPPAASRPQQIWE